MSPLAVKLRLLLAVPAIDNAPAVLSTTSVAATVTVWVNMLFALLSVMLPVVAAMSLAPLTVSAPVCSTLPVALTSNAPVTVVAPSVVVLLAPVTVVVRFPVEPETVMLPALVRSVAPPVIKSAMSVPALLRVASAVATTCAVKSLAEVKSTVLPVTTTAPPKLLSALPKVTL